MTNGPRREVAPPAAAGRFGLDQTRQADRDQEMSFGVGTLAYRGRDLGVPNRRAWVTSIGRGVDLKRLILENVTCDGDLQRLCPRGGYPFWREIWPQRVEE